MTFISFYNDPFIRQRLYTGKIDIDKSPKEGRRLAGLDSGVSFQTTVFSCRKQDKKRCIIAEGISFFQVEYIKCFIIG
jgi:hypothetical protein